jgi:2-polyprenyl-3-methyl-5-hydroxy-6-metoxy-1,4-benzoquinol methylase
MQSDLSFRANSRRCPNCKATRIRRAAFGARDTPQRQGIVRLRICANCGLAWQWPIGRKTDESHEWFAVQYESQEPNTYFDPKWRREVAALKLAFVGTLVSLPSSILDIGAGDGTFLRAAGEAGWRAVGVDPSLQTSLESHDVGPGAWRLLAGTTDLLGADEVFDVVTLWDVIEHVEDPVKLLVAAVSHLSKDGTLVIETGNYWSCNRLEEADEWWGYQLEHRWYFSPSTLEPLLQKIGLDSFQYSAQALEPGCKSSPQYLGPSRLHLLQSMLRKPWQAPKALRRYRDGIIVSHAPLQGIPIFAVGAKRRAAA